MDGSISRVLQARWWLSALCLIAASHLWAQSMTLSRPRPSIEAKVMEYGVMTVSKTELDNRGRPKVTYTPMNPILAERDLSFGMTWRNVAATGSMLTPMELVIVHPEMKKDDGTVTREMRNKVHGGPINGTELRHFGFKFEHQHELVAGEWKIQIYYDNKLLIEQAFQIALKEVK